MPRFHALKLERDSVFLSQNHPRWGGKPQAGGEAGRGTPQSGQEGGRPGCQGCHPGCRRYF